MTTTTIKLANIGSIKVSGVDAKKLLQGQLTCDVEQVTPESSGMGAHCNPQGRIISLFYICLYQDDYHLIMPRTLIPIALAGLKKYAGFYKVSAIDASTEVVIAGMIGSNRRILINPRSDIALSTDTLHWKLMNINAGIPELYPETSGKFLPHELNLQDLGAISFNKGCYTGQEIIARMHYRGKLKKRMHVTTIESETDPIPGDDIFFTDHETTQVGGSIVTSALEADHRYRVLVVVDDSHAHDNHLYLSQDPNKYFMFNQANPI